MAWDLVIDFVWLGMFSLRRLEAGLYDMDIALYIRSCMGILGPVQYIVMIMHRRSNSGMCSTSL